MYLVQKNGLHTSRFLFACHNLPCIQLVEIFYHLDYSLVEGPLPLPNLIRSLELVMFYIAIGSKELVVLGSSVAHVLRYSDRVV